MRKKVRKNTKTSSVQDYPLSERIRYLRQRRNLTQAQLAKKAGVSQPTIALLEKGTKDPSITTLRKLAEALDVHVAVLFTNDNVLVFDLVRLKEKYKSIDELNPTVYYSISKVLDYAKSIGFVR